MQKVINILAVVSFVGVAGIIGGGATVYLRRDAIIEDVKGKITAAVTETVTNALPGMLDSAMPEIPEVPTSTGGVMPL
jgi:hypothetical protein|tara:strand:+ start:112 stop:345 length:234 start_codon:yes stop_codon:yes gene_type:complete